MRAAVVKETEAYARERDGSIRRALSETEAEISAMRLQAEEAGEDIAPQPEEGAPTIESLQALADLRVSLPVSINSP